MHALIQFCLGILGIGPALGVIFPPTKDPLVKLKYGTFQGNTTGDLEEYLGMPFAAPPIGNLRFKPPQAPVSFQGVRQANSYGAACLQQSVNASAIPPMVGSIFLEGSSTGAPPPTNFSEDCLFINVIKPTNLPAGKKLPVLFWIFGGGFESGDSSLYPGNAIVSRSIELGEPIIYVSANYRLTALGFLEGKEAKAAKLGNIGLRDQRFALQWVHDNIAKFGGDPDRVTIWGESAGAISVSLHLFINNGDPAGLFYGAFMQSGSPTSMQPIDSPANQAFFDQLVSDAGCTGNSDPIACLRALPIDQLMTAINLSPSILTFLHLPYSWQPSIDGDVISRDPLDSIQQRLYAKVPIVSGDCDDEGTFFSLTNTNITSVCISLPQTCDLTRQYSTNDEFLSYIRSNILQGISDDDLAALGEAYPDDVTQGSPFNTGSANALTPEFKRLSAFQGDIGFQAPRRFFLRAASETQPTFAYLFKRQKSTPYVGAFHGSDIPQFFASSAIPGFVPDFIATDTIINFANTGNPSLPENPNSGLSVVEWKHWGSSRTNPPMLTFLDQVPAISITSDVYRTQPIELLNNLSLKLRPGL